MDRFRRLTGRAIGKETPAPAPPPDSSAAAHADHWGCIFGTGEKKLLQELIVRTLMDDAGIEVFQRSLRAEKMKLAARSRDERLKACVLVKNREVVTAYPEVQGGPIWPITLDEILPMANGLEGRLNGTCHGAAISFFDTRFYANGGRYAAGETYDFHMNALGYVVGPAPDTEVETELGVKVSLRGAHAFLPAHLGSDLAESDEYWFHSPLEGEIATHMALGKSMRLFPVITALPEDFEMRLHVYAGDHRLDRGTVDLSPGDDLQGYFWLQGYLSA